APAAGAPAGTAAGPSARACDAAALVSLATRFTCGAVSGRRHRTAGAPVAADLTRGGGCRAGRTRAGARDARVARIADERRGAVVLTVGAARGAVGHAAVAARRLIGGAAPV